MDSVKEIKLLLLCEGHSAPLRRQLANVPGDLRVSREA